MSQRQKQSMAIMTADGMVMIVFLKKRENEAG